MASSPWPEFTSAELRNELKRLTPYKHELVVCVALVERELAQRKSLNLSCEWQTGVGLVRSLKLQQGEKSKTPTTTPCASPKGHGEAPETTMEPSSGQPHLGAAKGAPGTKSTPSLGHPQTQQPNQSLAAASTKVQTKSAPALGLKLHGLGPSSAQVKRKELARQLIPPAREAHMREAAPPVKRHKAPATTGAAARKAAASVGGATRIKRVTGGSIQPSVKRREAVREMLHKSAMDLAVAAGSPYSQASSKTAKTGAGGTKVVQRQRSNSFEGFFQAAAREEDEDKDVGSKKKKEGKKRQMSPEQKEAKTKDGSEKTKAEEAAWASASSEPTGPSKWQSKVRVVGALMENQGEMKKRYAKRRSLQRYSNMGEVDKKLEAKKAESEDRKAALCEMDEMRVNERQQLAARMHKVAEKDVFFVTLKSFVTVTVFSNHFRDYVICVACHDKRALYDPVYVAERDMVDAHNQALFTAANASSQRQLNAGSSKKRASPCKKEPYFAPPAPESDEADLKRAPELPDFLHRFLFSKGRIHVQASDHTVILHDVDTYDVTSAVRAGRISKAALGDFHARALENWHGIDRDQAPARQFAFKDAIQATRTNIDGEIVDIDKMRIAQSGLQHNTRTLHESHIRDVVVLDNLHRGFAPNQRHSFYRPDRNLALLADQNVPTALVAAAS